MFKEAMISDINSRVEEKLAAAFKVPNPTGKASNGSDVKAPKTSPDMATPLNNFVAQANTVGTPSPLAAPNVLSNNDIFGSTSGAPMPPSLPR